MRGRVDSQHELCADLVARAGGRRLVNELPEGWEDGATDTSPEAEAEADAIVAAAVRSGHGYDPSPAQQAADHEWARVHLLHRPPSKTSSGRVRALPRRVPRSRASRRPPHRRRCRTTRAGPSSDDPGGGEGHGVGRPDVGLPSLDGARFVSVLAARSSYRFAAGHAK
jgi:hypothetical protein